jgi:hypothetical protein
VRANLSRTKVAAKLKALVRNDPQKAAGVLVDFWSGVSEFATDGYIRDSDDATLEAWASWKGRPGVFAKWVRDHHMDPDGRVPHWDEYQGALESRKVRDRERKRQQRERQRAKSPQEVTRTSNGSHADSPQDVPPHGTERYGTVRNKNFNTQELPSRRRAKKPREASAETPSWVQSLTDLWLERVGGVTHGAVGKVLKPIVEKHSLEDVVAAVQVYASPDEGPKGTRSVGHFAQNFAHWHRLAQTPLVDQHGVLTERGHRVGRES